MALRARKPEQIEKRLKLFLYGSSGVGKSTAAIQFHRSYLIDAERGLENYADLITKSNSVVFQSTDAHEIVKEIQSLRTEEHDYRTLVIDPITPIYNDLLDQSEKLVGSDFGRHYGQANKVMKRLVNLIMALDMNVIVTAHEKNDYGDNLKVLGQTFDGWKKLDYIFDLVLQLQERGERRVGVVRKTRLKSFPHKDEFEWSYDEFADRYGRDILERKAETVVLATEDQVTRLNKLLETIKLPENTIDKWLSKAEVDSFSEMTDEQITKCIEFCEKRLN